MLTGTGNVQLQLAQLLCDKIYIVIFKGCPLWDSNEHTEHERRQFFIARLPNIEMLNGGGAIETDEREDAERAFIRYYMEKPESERPER